MNTVVWGRLVSTVHPALEDNSIDGDKVGALCPFSGHWDTFWASVKGAAYIDRKGSWSGTSEVFKTWPGYVESWWKKGWIQERMESEKGGGLSCQVTERQGSMSAAVAAVGWGPGFPPDVALHTSRSEPKAQLHAFTFALLPGFTGTEPICLILPETAFGLILCDVGSGSVLHIWGHIGWIFQESANFNQPQSVLYQNLQNDFVVKVNKLGWLKSGSLDCKSVPRGPARSESPLSVGQCLARAEKLCCAFLMQALNRQMTFQLMCTTKIYASLIRYTWKVNTFMLDGYQI